LIRLAERGDARAQTRLGYSLEIGRGVPQNHAEAVYWYRRAAEQGEPDAQYLLAYCLHIGRGTPPDLIAAHKWMNLSAARIKDGNEREHRVRMRDIIATKLTRPQVEEAQFLALTWYPKRER
jgi:TPR repeat protein